MASAGQLKHPEWDGFALYDLIFPLFLFMAGVAMPLSFEKRLARGDSKSSLYRHVIIRGLLLVLLGMIYNGLLKFNWPDTRLPSVLGRIGLAYMFAGLIVLNTERARADRLVRRAACWLLGGVEIHSGAGIRRRRFDARAHAYRLSWTDCLFPAILYNKQFAIPRVCWQRCRRSALRWPAPSPASFSKIRATPARRKRW